MRRVASEEQITAESRMTAKYANVTTASRMKVRSVLMGERYSVLMDSEGFNMITSWNYIFIAVISESLFDQLTNIPIVQCNVLSRLPQYENAEKCIQAFQLSFS